MLPALIGSEACAQQRPIGSAGGPRRVETVALSPAVRDSLRRSIQRLVDSAGIPSLTVGLSVGGRTAWAEGFGLADVAAGRPATPDTPYSIASISKPITATAIMQLAERGRIRLDAPAGDYLRSARLTGLAGSADSVTIRRLLSHTAGLPLHYRFYYAASGEDTVPAPDVAATIERYGVVVYPPGAVYNYSNLGYGILGEIVAAAAGTAYESYVRDHVFAPLGMRSSAIGTGAGVPDAAVRYAAPRQPIPPYDFDHRGASAVYASANDLLRFGELHLRVRRGVPRGILHDTSIVRMQQVATPPNAAGSGYGLGWSVDEEFGVRRVRHTGGMPGVNTVLALYPDAGVAVVALANQASPLPARVAADLAAAVMPQYASARAAARAQARADQSVAARSASITARNAAPAAFVAPAEARGTWRGTVRLYDRSIPMELWVGDSDIRVRLGERALWTLLNDASWQNGLLGGRFPGTIPTDDARRAPHVVATSLRLHEGALRGWIAAQVNAPTNDFSLSSYVHLVKESTVDTP